MELGEILANSNIPLLSALLLGIQTAICPCPMVTNITAIGFIGKDLNNRKRLFLKGLLYTLGGIIAYTALAFILIPIIREGASIYPVQKAINKYGTVMVPVVFVVFGLFILFGKMIKLPSIDIVRVDSNKLGEMARNGFMGSILLGIVLALAFCPTTALIYFGMLLPMAAVETNGFLLPVVYALAASVPVVVTAWVVAYSLAGLGKFYNRINLFEKWFSRIVALLFIALGTIKAILFFI